MSRLPIWPLLTPDLGACCNCHMRVDIPPTIVSTDYWRWRRDYYWLAKMKVWIPYLAFSDTTLVGVLQNFVTACLLWNSKPAPEHLLLGLGVGSQIFLWCLAGVEQLLQNVFFLSRLPLSWPFG